LAQFLWVFSFLSPRDVWPARFFSFLRSLHTRHLVSASVFSTLLLPRPPPFLVLGQRMAVALYLFPFWLPEAPNPFQPSFFPITVLWVAPPLILNFFFQVPPGTPTLLRARVLPPYFLKVCPMGFPWFFLKPSRFFLFYHPTSFFFSLMRFPFARFAGLSPQVFQGFLKAPNLKERDHF